MGFDGQARRGYCSGLYRQSHLAAEHQSDTQRRRILTCGATTGFEAVTDLRYVWVREISIIGSNGWGEGDLHTLLDLVSRKKLKPVIDRVLPLEDIREAHRLIEEREFFGKIIIHP
ncbi:zinc-binding dehydrogenase [Paenibacillus sp. AR247]|uniref:zinc-binding dehydrogenase n=1 Tax=Paenibacillus sp. AR247 TaxID=1631599 RepID=UPI0021582D06|nr:zinc-binding dehydrogenase [Paenibacillus sp. AR247]